MEKIYYKPALILIVLTFISFSCKKDFLDQKPTSSITELTYYKNVSELETGLDACYSGLRSWAADWLDWMIGDLNSDDADAGSLFTDQPDLYNISYSRQNPSNGWVLQAWWTYYIIIARCNQVIDKSSGAQSGTQADSVAIEKIVNQARFLRAFSFYNLVTSFGDVPLVNKFLNPDELNLKRASSADIWAQIESDLNGATNLPTKYEWNLSGDQSGRITSGAAWSLLGKVYLTEGKYEQANSAFFEVINSGEYQLIDDFGKIFRKDGKNCEESIFELQTTNDVSLGGNLGTWNVAWRLPRDPGQGWGFDCPTKDLLEEFEPGDPRIIYTFMFPGDVFLMGSDTYTVENAYSPTGYNSRKAWVPWAERESLNAGDWEYNTRFIRYAEVLLLYAESLNESNRSSEALAFLNQVRARARKTPTTDLQRISCAGDTYLTHSGELLPDVTTTDRSELRKAIWHEQRVELAIEGKRRNMLLRINQFKDRMEAAKKYAGVTVQDYELLLPIPQQEIELSNHVLIQNPGY